MSLHILNKLNSPPIVAAAGCAVFTGLPLLEAATAAAPLALIKGANAAAFALNVVAVSVPGRIDEAQDVAMRKGEINPNKPRKDTKDDTSKNAQVYPKERTRTLVSPSGWAFAIWGPIYLGEAIFVGSQLLANPSSGELLSPLASALPQISGPFIAANVFQSLWCASFRPSYGSKGWPKYVSVGMLAATGYSLSHVHAVACSADVAPSLSWFLLPLTLHFGWTTAAPLVNLNGSVAMNPDTKDSTVISVGHASAVAATALGVGFTLAQASPAYGLTLAWALAACGDGMRKRVAAAHSSDEKGPLLTGAKVQKALCWAGSAACLAASVAAAM